MRKGWIVTKDYIGDNIPEGSKFEKVEIIGPRGCTLSASELIKGHPFKMFDDDGNLYYFGFLFGDKESEDGFFPLDHYGTPNAGCTYIQYKDKDGKWSTL
jgi:hypothetical protein